MLTYFPRVVIAFALLTAFMNARASGALQFYYDTDTGNVSFDTANTRSGEIVLYTLTFNVAETEMRFLFENHIRLTSSTLFVARSNSVQEATLDSPLSGLFTIGNVLPPGLSEETWKSVFNINGSLPATDRDYSLTATGWYSYVDQLGAGPAPPPEFIYGPPEGEFDNKWSLVDPNTLNWAQKADLVYVASTGEVIIDTTGPESGYISSYLLSSDDAFQTENYSPATDSRFETTLPGALALLANAIEPGRYNLGSILRPGMTLEDFNSTVTSAQFVAQAGFSRTDFDYAVDGVDMQFVYQAVPEPNTFALIVVIFLFSKVRR